MATNSPSTPSTIDSVYLPRLENILMIIVWLIAAIGVLLPFALGTSPLDALLMRVPNNEGNWWHVLVGLPFFLSLPMIWMRWHVLNSATVPALLVRRIFWIMIIFSAFGTLLVETPFLLHRAGTSERQRLEVIFLGMGIILLAGIFLFVKQKKLHPTIACIIGATAAYLANAFLCLIVYGEEKFGNQSRDGWYVTAVIVLPIFIDAIWLMYKKTDAEK